MIFFKQMHWLGDDDPIKIKAINDGPVIDFFIMLDEKIKRTKKQVKRIQKTKK